MDTVPRVGIDPFKERSMPRLIKRGAIVDDAYALCATQVRSPTCRKHAGYRAAGVMERVARRADRRGEAGVWLARRTTRPHSPPT